MFMNMSVLLVYQVQVPGIIPRAAIPTTNSPTSEPGRDQQVHMGYIWKSSAKTNFFFLMELSLFLFILFFI